MVQWMDGFVQFNGMCWKLNVCLNYKQNLSPSLFQPLVKVKFLGTCVWFWKPLKWYATNPPFHRHSVAHERSMDVGIGENGLAHFHSSKWKWNLIVTHVNHENEQTKKANQSNNKTSSHPKWNKTFYSLAHPFIHSFVRSFIAPKPPHCPHSVSFQGLFSEDSSFPILPKRNENWHKWMKCVHTNNSVKRSTGNNNKSGKSKVIFLRVWHVAHSSMLDKHSNQHSVAH